jgi:hypothetical protein
MRTCRLSPAQSSLLLSAISVLACNSILGIRAPSDNPDASGGHGGTGAPTAIVIDNFEDGDAQSGDARFGSWKFYAYNPSALPTGAHESSTVESPGYDSNYALNLDWEVVDVPDGMPNYPGVGLGCAPVSYIDISGYSAILFAQQYSHTGSCQPVLNLTVVFGCSQYNASFIADVPMSAEWTTTTIQLSSFSQQQYPPETTVALEDCFKVVDSFDFQAQQNLADGDCASGTLTLDNISIR